MYVCINQSLEVHNYIGMLIDVDCWAKLEEQISWANQIIDMHCLDASHRNSFEMTKWNHMHKIHFATPKHRTWNALVPIQLAFVIINFANGNFTYAISTLNWDKWMASVHESHRTSTWLKRALTLIQFFSSFLRWEGGKIILWSNLENQLSVRSETCVFDLVENGRLGRMVRLEDRLGRKARLEHCSPLPPCCSPLPPTCFLSNKANFSL